MKVLVVDDDASVSELLHLSLAEAGYDVTVASTGDSAYAMIAPEGFEIIVSDVDLPGLLKGGAWSNPDWVCSVQYPNGTGTAAALNFVGFRVVRP